MGCRQPSGFTLIEVLVAFVILATALTVIFETLGTGSRARFNASDLQIATMLAESRLATLSVQNPPKIGDDQGVHDGRYRWTSSVKVAEPGEGLNIPGYRLYEFVVRVDSDRSPGRPVELHTFRLREAQR